MRTEKMRWPCYQPCERLQMMFKIWHAESSGFKGTFACKKNPHCIDKLRNQYYKHLKLRGKMVERFSIHIYQKILKLTNTTSELFKIHSHLATYNTS